MSELKMLVSCTFTKDGSTKACVSFEDDNRFAEGLIPDCTITRNNGFSDDEVSRLEAYMTENLETLKRMASDVNPIRKLMKD